MTREYLEDMRTSSQKEMVRGGWDLGVDYGHGDSSVSCNENAPRR